MIHPINMPADFMRAPPARRRLIRERSGDQVFSENDVRRKATITYTEDGRRLRDGEPTSPRSPNALWNEFFLRSFVRKLYLDEDGKDSAAQGDGEGLDAPEETTPQCAIHFPVPQMRSEEKRARSLELKWADLKIRENANQHNTADFDLVERRNNAQLVVRRGQTFAMDLEFYWDVDVDSDSLALVFELGSLPSESKGTRLVIPLKKHANVVDCTVDRLAIDGARVSVSVSLSARTIVGAWQVKIVSAVNKKDSTFNESESPIGTVYVLFNPWCTNDQVYMPNAADRDEYVLNDVGQIWRGTHGAPKATAWSYGQFESGVLEACLQ
uniref:Transglutaminase N-terminal domain-containing protein n=1 Tax=Plectus sambesii TaxID=2011161 RepID=A0A914UNS7_9BILA